jgi:hypothetical protein
MHCSASGRCLILLFLASLTSILSAATATESAPPAAAVSPQPSPPPEPALDWHDVTTWGIEGRAFVDAPRARWFDRFPSAAEGKVTPNVWSLSRDSAGMMVRFRTDATSLWADYTLLKGRLAGANMTAIGASGLDLYAKDSDGAWRWAGVARPSDKTGRQEIIGGLAPGMREYAIYLPLYNGVENLSIGVPAGASFEGIPPRADKPIVFYGTSITHGASASRPGMVHTAILGRRLDRPVINLGFSGNGRMDPEVGEFLVTIDAAVVVIDCLPNMDAAQVRAKCPPLVHQLRAAHPATPIVLVEDRRNTNSWILPARNQHHTDNHAALRECFDQLQQQGVTRLYYIRGDDLLGDDKEGTTDGSHPSDLGFLRQADVFEPVLRTALGE